MRFVEVFFAFCSMRNDGGSVQAKEKTPSASTVTDGEKLVKTTAGPARQEGGLHLEMDKARR